MATPREHIEEIRRHKFSIGGQENPLITDLHKAVKLLSAELYTKDVHFLMELIQNAEDNEYPGDGEPKLEFLITTKDLTAVGAPATLLILNNEKGFRKHNIDSLCSVGRSTKEGRRQEGYIGEKGIGFKSVFLITRQPCIFSNGYRIRFNEVPPPGDKMGYIVPEWIDEKPTIEELQQVYGSALPSTTIVLPLRPEKVEAVQQQLAHIHPEMILFMSKIKTLRVREDNDQKPGLSRINAISVERETDLRSTKNEDSESFTLHLSAEENQNMKKECSYYMWRQRFSVKPESRVDERKGVEEWVITLAFPFDGRLSRSGSMAAAADIYAFLPTEMITRFPFVIQADFLLASSRESILLDSKWNAGILECVPSAFCSAFVTLLGDVDSAPAASRAQIFKYLPIDIPPYPQLVEVRTAIQGRLGMEHIIPCETLSLQQSTAVCKPTEARRILPAFREILRKASEQGLPRPGGGWSIGILHSCLDRDTFSRALAFLDVVYAPYDWYSRCIQSPGWLTGLPEDLYVELLCFLAENWHTYKFSSILEQVPVFKYVTFPNKTVAFASLSDTASGDRRVYTSSKVENISWLSQWTRELGCVSQYYFMPADTQTALQDYGNHQWVRMREMQNWLKCHAMITEFSVLSFCEQLLQEARSSRNGDFVIKVAQFFYYSSRDEYLDRPDLGRLCKELPIVDKRGAVQRRNAETILVPACIGKWAKLMGTGLDFVTLSEDYLRPPSCTGKLDGDLLSFVKTHLGAMDIPELFPPDCPLPVVSSPLSIKDTFLLLEWVQRFRYRLPQNFRRSIMEGNWLRTHSGYKSPKRSFLFDSKSWQSALKLSDVPFIDDAYYGPEIHEFKDALAAIGVVTEFGGGCDVIAEILPKHKEFQAITRLYQYLHRFGWRPEPYDPVKIWIPGCDQSNVADEWIDRKLCVIHDDNGLFKSRLKVLESYYDATLLPFFSESLGVSLNPRIEDYCDLWRDWTFDQQYRQITQVECCLVWKKIVRQWGSSSSNIKHYLRASSESLRLPVIEDAGNIGLSGVNEAFVPDDLHLKELFVKKGSSRPRFTWHPNPSDPDIPLDLLFSIYNQLGARNISQSVQKVELSVPTSTMRLSKIIAGEGMIGKGLCRTVLGYLSNPSFKLAAGKRHQIAGTLVEASVFESSEPFMIEYSVSFPDQRISATTSSMVSWDKGRNTIWTAKTGKKARMPFAIDFARVISEGLLWEHPEFVSGLCEIVRLGCLVGFDIETVNLLLQTKNLQLFMEDEEFLSRNFPSEARESASPVCQSILSGAGGDQFQANANWSSVSAEADNNMQVEQWLAKTNDHEKFEGWGKSLSILKQFALDSTDTTARWSSRVVREMFNSTPTDEMPSDDCIELRVLKVLADAYLKLMSIFEILLGSHGRSSVTFPVLEVGDLVSSGGGREGAVKMLGLAKYFVEEGVGIGDSSLPEDGVMGKVILGAMMLGFYALQEDKSYL